MRALLAERGGGPSSADKESWSEGEKAQVSWLGLVGLGLGLGLGSWSEEETAQVSWLGLGLGLGLGLTLTMRRRRRSAAAPPGYRSPPGHRYQYIPGDLQYIPPVYFSSI